MDTNKILKVLGLFFVVLGAVIGIGLILSGFAAKSIPLAFMGIVFVMMFCGIGGFFAWIGISMLNRDKKITEEGVAVMGKIFDYVPDYQMTLNGQPTLSLVVRYKRDGVIRQATVRTGRSDTAEFPQGATVTRSLLNGEAALVPGTVTDLKLPDEENLMNRDIDPEKIESSVGVSCPACGAALMVPVGMTAICPYCGRKVKADKSGIVK